MHPDTLTQFFLWCSVINTGLMFFWILIFKAAPDWIYRTQTVFFPIGREQYTVVLYGFLAAFKTLVIVFNWVPYFALRIMS
ncbi:hypothetical protein DRQ53_09990 [bacterium]|nr:MAG: hypothetical protein DRQ32_01210 [bacterium]RKZ15074.1 MAG: hypothetical protein DRQ53_09990 [bacterium]